MKLVNNMMSITLNVTTAEALMLAEARARSAAGAQGDAAGHTCGARAHGDDLSAKVLRKRSHSRLHGRPCAQDLGSALDLAAQLRLAVPTAVAARKLTTMPGRGTALTTGPPSHAVLRDRWRALSS
jgi:3-hydroxyisobutyrate dehydrogenase-like beta-hydroxyacid dehydrogenase